MDQFVTFEIFFGTFLRSLRILFIPTSKVCRWRFFYEVFYTTWVSNYSINYVTQSTHSTVVDYLRRNKYDILPPDFESQKNISPWPSRTLGATAGYGMNSHPTPGSLFAMGWSRLMAKDYIRFFKLAKKKNIYWWHPFYFIFFVIHPRSSPTRSHFIPPALSTGRASFRVPPSSRPRVLGWLSGLFVSFIGFLRPRRIFFCYFLSINSTAEPTPQPHPTRSTPVASLLRRPLHRFHQL